VTTAAGNTPAVHVLDSNVFIDAKNLYYAFDVCPGFWNALVWHCSQGRLLSIDRVKAELARGNDELKEWALTVMPAVGFSGSNTEPVLAVYAQAVSWAMAQPQYTPAAKAEFADENNADAWVVAYAKAMRHIVVTHEKANPTIQRRIPLPNVCQALGVPFIDTFGMLRALDTQFSWQQP
jgi:hypothetical protein